MTAGSRRRPVTKRRNRLRSSFENFSRTSQRYLIRWSSFRISSSITDNTPFIRWKLRQHIPATVNEDNNHGYDDKNNNNASILIMNHTTFITDLLYNSQLDFPPTIRQLGAFRAWEGVKIWPIPLLWLLDFTALNVSALGVHKIMRGSKQIKWGHVTSDM